MSRATLFSIVIAVLATGGMVLAFLNNASPYVTVAQARTMQRSGLHVVGRIDKSTLNQRVRERTVEFELVDAKGDRMPVLYRGAPISNMAGADQIVVVGKVADERFEAEQIIVKCPSKYEGQTAEGNAPPSGAAAS